MISLPVAAARTSLLPAGLDVLRVFLTYVLPAVAVFYVVICGLWLVPDSFAGMYGNHDGRWASWSARGILEWSGFLDFSPVSPLSGTGSLFLPNLPWLNPGSLALALPVSLPVRHLASMLIYAAELAASLYLLYRHLDFSRDHAFLATLLYFCIFFIPFAQYTDALPWYALAPVNAHLIAAMNLATISLIRVGYERSLGFKALFGFGFLASLFVAFASAPVTALTYLPVYGLLWIGFLLPSGSPREGIRWRFGAIAAAVLVFSFLGALHYLSAVAMVSARGESAPPMFHPGWQLLSATYWQNLVSNFPACSKHMQLMCPSSIIGGFEIAALAGSACLVLTCSGTKRRYGLIIIALLALLHFYALLSMDQILGRLHTISTPYLMWALFPLTPPAVIAAGNFILGRITAPTWSSAAAGSLIAIGAVFAWMWVLLPAQPRPLGRGSFLPLHVPPIAHLPVGKGTIVAYLQQHIGLTPGSEFRGYAATFLGAPDGVVRKWANVVDERMRYDTYVAAREIVFDHFGNSFQMMDLWNNDIPTLEEYGQSVSKQMYYFNRDLLADPRDQVDPLPSSILVYRFRPRLLRALGVRFVITDGRLEDAGIEHVMTQEGKAGATVNLYEIKGANLGQFSPTQLTWAADYATAVRALREPIEFEQRVVLLGAPERQPELVVATQSRLVAVRDGYRLTASAPGRAMVVLPIQFSHCWKIEGLAGTAEPPRLLRANIVQTGVLFENHVDIRLRFDFEPWHASCRLQDAHDLTFFAFK